MRISEERKPGNVIRGAVAGCLFLVLFSLTAFASETLSLSVTYGYRNTAKNGQMLPVTIGFSSTVPESISGYVVIESDGNGASLSYTFPVEIPEGDSVQKYTVTLPGNLSGREGDRLRVSVMDDLGEILGQETVSVTYHGNGDDVLIGILSEDLESLLYFGNTALPGGVSTKTVTLNPADLPEDAEGLSQLDMIVISAFDLSRLSPESVSAIYEWTLSGGTLLFGAGSRSFSFSAFQEYLEDVELSLGRFEEMDLGMEYSETGPDGAVKRLYIRPVIWEGSSRLFDNGDTALIHYSESGNGRIGIAVCDLCSLSGFCLEHPAFTEDLLSALIGDRKTFLRKEPEEEALLTNTYRKDRIPSLFGYAVIAVLYVLFCGPLLYHLLKEKGLGIFYMPGTVMLSALFVLILFLASQKTRIEEPYIDYGAILFDDGSGEDPELTAVIRTGTPEKRPVTIELPGSLSVRPVEVYGDVSVTGGKKRMLAFTGQQQFEENIISLGGQGEAISDGPVLRADLRRKGISFSGSLVNISEIYLRDAVLVAGGETVFLGDLAPGQEAYLEACKALYGPVSEAIQKEGQAAAHENDPVQKAALLRRALDGIYLTDPGEVFVTAFADPYTPSFLRESRYTLRGETLFVFTEPVSESTEEKGYLNVLCDPVTVVSGTDDAETNSVTTDATTVLTYSLGNGYEIGSMRFVGLSEELAGGNLRAFSGQVSIYNYEEGGYDLLDAGVEFLSGRELGPYLSPANNITLRYMPDSGDGEEVRMVLPAPYVTRTAPVTEPWSEMTPEES